MANTSNIIEIKRGLHKICNRDLVNIIANLDDIEDFYCDIFQTYGLLYNTETIRQKRVFVAAITNYFLLDRLPKDSLCIVDDKYENNNIKNINEIFSNTIKEFYKIKNSCTSFEEFKKNYAEYYSEEEKSFENEISQNRDDSLSDFAKSIEKVYQSNSKDDNC